MIATNHRIESDGMAEFLSERSRRVVKSIPYCTSILCVAHYINNKLRMDGVEVNYVQGGVIKSNTKRTDIDCRDCGSALFWRVTKREVYEVQPPSFQ